MGQNAIKKRAADAGSKHGDIYAWARRQAALLRKGRLDEIDSLGIAEEIDDVGEEQYYRLEGALRVLAHHLLNWDRQPAARSRSWALSILEQRRRAARQLQKNPGLKSRLDEALSEAYEGARIDAARETGLPLGAFPVESPYALAELMDRPILWPGEEAE